MAIYSASGHSEVIAAIVAENTFEYPLTVDNTKITKVEVNSSDPSKARVTVDGVFGSGMRGFTSVNMNRINVATLVQGVSTIIKSNSDSAMKVSDVLPSIREQLGIDLTADWIVDEELVLGESVGDKPLYGATLKIKDNHPVLYGSFDFKVDGIILDINRLITVTDVNGITDPLAHQPSKYSAFNLIYGIDYTGVSDKLSEIELCNKPLTITTAIRKKIADAISTVDGFPWICRNSTSPFNIEDSVILSHCRTVDFDVAGVGVNTDYSHVLLLRMYPHRCSNISYDTYDGILIHYDRLEGLS